MALYIGGVNYIGGTNPVYTVPNAASAGAFLSAGVGTSFWAYPGNTANTIGATFATRSILTHGYTVGGYRNANPWRSMNKTWHATDITVYQGEQLDRIACYNGGTFSDYYGYCHGSHTVDLSSAAGNFTTANMASTHTSSYNLHTGIGRTVSAAAQATSSTGAAGGLPFGYVGKDPNADGITYGAGGSAVGTGSAELTVARSYFGAATNQTGQVGYICGGPQSTATDKFHMPTEIMYAGTATTAAVGSHTAAGGGETKAYWSFAAALRYNTYSNDAWTTWAPTASSGSTAISTDGVCKFLTTKLGYHYGGNSSNNTSGFSKWSDSTGNILNNTLSKPIANGEENFQMGQNAGYCIGTYNGLQVNYSWKVNYLTDVSTAGGTALQPKGHGGASSATCASAAATITAGVL